MLSLYIEILSNVLIIVSLLSLTLFVPPAIQHFCTAFSKWAIHKFKHTKPDAKKRHVRPVSRFSSAEARRQYAEDLFRQIA